MRILPKVPLLLASLVMMGSAAVSAAPADYQCEGGALLTADFSPRKAQLRYEGQHWNLQRVRDSREARYVGAGVAITLKRSLATLERKDQPTLACKMVVQALRAETLGVTPAASAPAR